MEYPFSSKEKGVGYWAALEQGVQMDSSGQIDSGVGIPVPDDPFCSFADLMNFDSVGLYSSGSGPDQILSSYMLPNCPQGPYGSFDALNFADQGLVSFSDRFGASGSSYVFGDKSNLQADDTQIAYQLNLSNRNDPQQIEGGAFIPTPLGPSLNEKMLRAFSLFKQSSGVGILAQVWVPIQQGDKIILSTCEQPFLLDKMLEGYREVSRRYSFSAEEKPGSFPGLPGRVFLSKVPEWTSNVVYYNHNEYLRVKHAVDHNIRSSIALPIFDSNDMSCCAVLELVTIKEQPNFDAEMEKVCTALQAVNLRTTPPQPHDKQSLSRNQRAALAEIADVLRAVCHAHRFPLALTWIPCISSAGNTNEIATFHVHDRKKNPDEKYVLCVENTACYVSDKEMEGFVHACEEHYLGEGQGMVGKALQSNHPFFFPDVKAYDISEYPLVHHARRFGLNAAVAIRLRSTYTGDGDYVLEFFLPVNIKGSAEQQLLLDNLSRTMQRICRSLRTVSGAELGGDEGSKMRLLEATVPTSARKRSSNAVLSDSSMNYIDSRQKDNELDSDGPSEQATNRSRRQQEKKKSTGEKTVSLSVLQQYFSGSLKDAAKNIGVCPTTLKRICRQHGISRWPSRKINKVNRSLRKIQTVLDSVQGVEGGLKFDTTTHEFVAAGSSHSLDTQKLFVFPESISSIRSPDSCTQERNSAPCMNNENYTIKLEKDASMGEVQKPTPTPLESGRMKKNVSWSSSSFAVSDQMDTRHEGDYEVVHNGPPCSSMMDSSIGSGLIMHGSSSSSQSFEERKHTSKPELNCIDSGTQITVKVTYRDDMFLFKFEPSYGCFQLYEEVAKRFRIQNGMFQLKYLDDDDEWVMLSGDSDLQECLEIMEDCGTRSVKFLVCDSPATMGSSGSSNCFLMDGS